MQLAKKSEPMCVELKSSGSGIDSSFVPQPFENQYPQRGWLSVSQLSPVGFGGNWAVTPARVWGGTLSVQRGMDRLARRLGMPPFTSGSLPPVTSGWLESH